MQHPAVTLFAMSVAAWLLVTALAASGGSQPSARLLPAGPALRGFAQVTQTYVFSEHRVAPKWSPASVAAFTGGALLAAGAVSWGSALVLDRSLAAGTAAGISSRAQLEARFLLVRSLELGGYVAAGAGVAALGYALFLATRPAPRVEVELVALPGGAFASIRGAFP